MDYLNCPDDARFCARDGHSLMSAVLTREQAQLIMDAHDITQILGDEEEFGLLEQNNPEIAEAYFALHRIAFGVDKDTKVENGFKP